MSIQQKCKDLSLNFGFVGQLITNKNEKHKQQAKCFVNNSLFEIQVSGCLCVASLAATLLGGQPLVSLLGDGQTDSLSSGQGHPRLVALETGWRKQEFVNVDQRERSTQVGEGVQSEPGI